MQYDKVRDICLAVAGTLLLIMFNDLRRDVRHVAFQMEKRDEAFANIVRIVDSNTATIQGQEKILEKMSAWPTDRWTRSDHREFRKELEARLDKKFNALKSENLRQWNRMREIEKKTGVKIR